MDFRLQILVRSSESYSTTKCITIAVTLLPLHRTPFELNSTIRCFLMAVIDLYQIEYSFLVVSLILTYLFGIITYTKAILFDIKSIFNRMDKSLKFTDKNAEPTLLQYCKEAIDLHAQVYRCISFQNWQTPMHWLKSIISSFLCSCMKQLTDVMNIIIFVTVTPSIACICLCLFLIETVSSTTRTMSMCKTFFSMSIFSQYDGVASFYAMQMQLMVIAYLLQLIFVFFYLGQMLHTSLDDLSDAIYQSEWYRYPRNIQKFVLIIILRAQQPLHISAFGIMQCNLANYLGVSETHVGLSGTTDILMSIFWLDCRCSSRYIRR